jgi:3-oxoacyl-[acyl-carrier-protein] synthase-1
MPRIFITGYGSISAIGDNVEQSLESLIAKKTGVAPITILDTVHKDEFVLAEVKYSNDELAQILGINNKDKTYTRTSLLAMIGAREAFQKAKLSENSDLRTGIVSANTGGGMDTTERYYKTSAAEQIVDFAITHSCGDSTEKYDPGLLVLQVFWRDRMEARCHRYIRRQRV